MHIPVLSEEVIELLNPQPGEIFVDATFGEGGHSRLIWQKIQPRGRLLALDWNKRAINLCRKKFPEFHCLESNFADLPQFLKDYPKIDGLLLDLGVSSSELENSGRGFSFRKDEPLLMTYSDQQKPVKNILAEINEKNLAEIIRKYGEERFAGRIAQSIKRGKVQTSQDLVKAILKAVPKSYRRGRIHPATRTFMALRIYANQELENLEKVLRSLLDIVASQGRAAVISFHSLEDRLVKQHFSKLAGNKAELLTKKPVRPTREEIKNNPRARSAKLRVLKIK